MSHVVLPNQAPPTTTDSFWGIWKTTRAMLAAGWKYKACADGQVAGTKDVSGNFAFDKWGIGGGVNLNNTLQSGTTSIALTLPAADGTVTCTFGSGTAPTFTSSSVGRFLVVSGFTNAVNNGMFRIVAQSSATVIKLQNSNAVAETTSVPWFEKESGANGTITAVSTNGALIGRAIFTVSSGTPFVAPVANPLNRGSVGDRITIIGAATGANNGTFMITRVISATSVEIDNSAATTDGNNGTLHWAQVSPTAQLYPTGLNAGFGAGAWYVLQGPSIMKIPIFTSVPTGTFQRGETVTQTLSGATGVILGVMTDTTTGTGYLVIDPRLNGNTGNPRGWSSAADTVTAAAYPAGSGASVPTTAANPPVEYIHEMVIWRAGALTGHIFCQCVDSVAESAQRFSVFATAAGVNTSLAPGSNGVFPNVGTWTQLGTAAQSTVATGASSWYNWSTGSNLGWVHALVANCIETATTCADGSWWVIQGIPVSGSAAHLGMGFQPCDDTEDGDVSPYVTFAEDFQGAYAGTRLVNATSSVGFDTFGNHLASIVNTHWRGYRRRGFGTGDAFQAYASNVLQFGTVGVVSQTNPGSPCRVANAVTVQQIREPIWVASSQVNLKQRKGTLRWAFVTEGGSAYGTFLNGTFVQVGMSQTSPTVVGPWDGVTVGSNA